MKEELDNLFKSDIENCLKLTRKINMDCSSLSNINIVSLTDSGTTIKIYNPLQKKNIYIVF